MSLQFEDHASGADDEFESDEPQPDLVPLEFAKAHIHRIEEDMVRMHERHVNLMKEMDTNYKMIEQET